MNKIRQYICAFLTAAVFLTANTAYAESMPPEARKKVEEQFLALIDSYNNNVDKFYENSDSIMKKLFNLEKIHGDITCNKNGKISTSGENIECEKIINMVGGYYAKTSGDTLDVIKSYGKNLSNMGDVPWTDHEYDAVLKRLDDIENILIQNDGGNSANCTIKITNPSILNQCRNYITQAGEMTKTLKAQAGQLDNLAAILNSKFNTDCQCNEATDTQGTDTQGTDTQGNAKQITDCLDDMTCTATDENGNVALGASKGCQSIMAKLNEIKTCPLCKIFKIILDTDQSIATQSYNALAHSFRNVIIMVMGLYIAYQTLLMVGAFTKQDAPKYITTLLVQAFKVGVAALLLTESSYIYNNVINPLMKGGMEFGQALIFPAENSNANTLTADLKEYGEFQEGAIGIDVLRKIMETVMAFNQKAAEMPAIGSSLICISVHEAASFLIDFSMFTQGLLLYAFGWMILLSASFYLLDSTVRFGIFCALVPFLIAAWPLKVTRSYTMSGWKIFINSFFNFAMMGLVLAVCLELVCEALGGSSEEVIAAINGNRVETLQKMMDMSGTSFLKTLVCCMFAFKMVKEVGALASEISGTSGGSSIGASIGGTAANVAKRTAGTAAKIGGKVTGVTDKVHKAQEKLGLREPSPASKLPQAPNPSGGGSGGSSGGASGNGGSSGDSGNGGNSGNTQTNSTGGAQGQNTQGGNSDAAQGGTGASGASENASGGNAGDSTDGSNQGGV